MALKALLIEGYPEGLKYTNNDIDMVKNAFERINAEVYTSKGNNRIVRDAITDICEKSFNSDIFIIYYTGHGFLKKGDLVLKVDNSDSTYHNFFNFSELIDITEISNFGKIIFIMDCCNASAAQKQWSNLDNNKFYLFYSCEKLEKSIEMDEFRSSVFTYCFVESITDLISKKNKTVRLDLKNISKKTKQKIEKINKSHESLGVPTPNLCGLNFNNVILYEKSLTPNEELAFKKEEYLNDFLFCVKECKKTCYNRFSWCETIFKNDIEILKYIIPTVNTIEEKMKLNTFFNGWIGTDRLYLGLLSNAGVGKSSACLYFFNAVCIKEINKSVIPIFIPLYLLQEKIQEKIDVYKEISMYSNGKFTDDEIMTLIQNKEIVLLLDGFDEINNDSTISSIIYNFDKIKPFFRLNCKTILTCRTHFFSEQDQITNVLEGKISGTDFATEIMGDEFNFEIIELQEFTELEILEVINAFMPDKDANQVWNDIKKIYDLGDLAKKPIILKMIIKTLPELQKRKSGKEITSSILYKTYTSKLLRKEMEQRRLSVDLSEKESFIGYIASLMWLNKTLKINNIKFSEQIEKFYSERIITTVDTNQYKYDSRVSSFFIRDKNDNYTFSHKSFFEYYLAKHCVSEMEKLNVDTWKYRWFDKEISFFIKDIISSEENKPVIYNLLQYAQKSTDPIIIWNTLHILSLLDKKLVEGILTDDIKTQISQKASRETNCVIIRQYCRLIAKFINREEAEKLIDKIINIVSCDSSQDKENNETYFNYYGGKDMACNAFINHLSVEEPKYDARLHLYLLKKFASKKYLDLLDSAIRQWKTTKYSSDILLTRKEIEKRN